MTIFVEIPHQTSPTVYESDVCLTSEEEQRDLSSFLCFDTAEEAFNFLMTRSGHGHLKAAQKLIDAGLVEEINENKDE